MLKGIQLTLMMGPVVAVPVPKYVIDALESAQVTVSAGARSGFQLTFGLSKNSKLQTDLIPAGFFSPFIRVILMVTLGGIPNVIFDGVITKQDVTASNDPAQSKLTITGEDLSVMMDLVDLTGLFSYPAMPVPAVLLVILAKYAGFGVAPLVIPPILSFVDPPTEKIAHHKGTDLTMINSFAKETGYVFYMIPGPVPGASIAYFGPEVRVGLPQPALSINMDASSNVESLRFSYDGLSGKTVVLLVMDPITHKIPIPVILPNISLLKPPLAAVPAFSKKVEILKDVAKQNPVKAALLGLSEVAGSSDAISGSGTLDVLRYGRLLGARQLVGVRGAGLNYDGLYYVKSVTHDIKRGEYKQNFTLSRDGTMPLFPKVNV